MDRGICGIFLKKKGGGNRVTVKSGTSLTVLCIKIKVKFCGYVLLT